MCLDIYGCKNALTNIICLCDLSSNYMGLTALNISGIENIKSVFFSVECAENDEETSIPRSGTFVYLRKLNISVEL